MGLDRRQVIKFEPNVKTLRMSSATIEDYKKYVRELKMRVKQLTEANTQLKTELEHSKSAVKGIPKVSGKPADHLAWLGRANKAILLIQKRIRGFLVRCKMAKSGRASMMVAKARQIELKMASENELMLQELGRACKKIGMTLEMLFRCADAHKEDHVTQEAFKTVLGALKLNLNKRRIEQLALLFDENNTGVIHWEDFCATLFAYGQATEPEVVQVGRRYLATALEELRQGSERMDGNPFHNFTGERLEKADFNTILRQVELKTGKNFAERDFDLFFAHFDRKKCGVVDKKTVIFVPPSPAEVANSPPNECRAPSQGHVKAKQLKTPVKKAIIKRGKLELGAPKGTSQTLSAVVSILDKKGPQLGRFLDKLADFIVQHRLKVFGKHLETTDFESFLNITFTPVLGEDLIHAWVAETPSVRVSDALGSNAGGKAKGETFKQCVDLIELKNTLTTASGKKMDCLRFLKHVLAANLDTSGANTTEYFVKNGLRDNRKIEFPEFYLAAQKVLFSSYPESMAIFESLDTQKQRCISIKPLIEEIQQIRSGVNTASPSSVSAIPPQSKAQALESAKKKMHLASLEGIERVLAQMQENTGQILEKLSQDQTNSLVQALVQNKLSESELLAILDSITFDDSRKIDVFTLLDFLLQTPGSKKQLVGVFVQVMGSFLDKNHPRESTADFFRGKKLHPNGFYDKTAFEKKIRSVFGFTAAHAALVSEEFFDAENETVDAGAFVAAVDRKRKVRPEETTPAQPKKLEEKHSLEPKEVPQSAKKEEKENTKPPKPTQEPKAAVTTVTAKSAKAEPAKPSEKSAVLNPQNTPQETDTRNTPKPSPPATKPAPEIIEDPKPSFNISENDENRLLAKVETLKASKLNDLIVLKNFIEEHPDPSIPLLQLRAFCQDLFAPEETRLLLQVFFRCDSDRNGSVSLAEWKKMNLKMKIEVPKEPVEVRPVIPEFKTEEDLFTVLTQDLDSTFILPLEYLGEFLEYQNRAIAAIELVRVASQFYKNRKESLEFFRRVMTFLDSDKNGFFPLGIVRMVVLLMNLREMRQAAAIAPFDVRFLTVQGLTLDIMRVLAREACDGFIRCTFMDFGLAEDRPTIDLFALSKNLSNCLVQKRDLEVVLAFVADTFKSRKSLTIEVDDFCRAIGAATLVKNWWQKTGSALPPDSLLSDLRKLKSKLVRSKEGRYAPITLRGSDVPKHVADIFSLDRSNATDVSQFATFVAFCTLPSLPSRSLQAADGPKSGQTASRLQSMCEMVSQFAFDNASKKLAQVNLTTEDLESLLDGIMSDRNQPVKLLTFCDIMARLPLNLDKHECYAVFDQLVTNGQAEIRMAALVELFQTLRRKNPNKRRESVRTVATSPAEKKWIEALKDKQVQPGDCFMGVKTILNGAVAALRRAADLVSALKPLEKFKDPDFGPCKEDPFGKRALYFDGTPAQYPEPEDMVWVRTDQIAPDKKPMFVQDQAYANEVNQGAIGDCWMIAALSQLAMNDDLLFQPVAASAVKENRLTDAQTQAVFSGVYPSIFHFLSKYGMYVFRFFKDGDYRFVIVDDQLPCYNNESDDLHLVFAHCSNRSVFWLPLIEKAYAKLHGCYEALIGGQMEEGVADMTGFVADKVVLKNAQGAFNAADLRSEDAAWKKWDAQVVDGSVLGCSVAAAKNQREADHVLNGEKTGLYCGHAYSIMDFLEVNGRKLVRIRNPHGANNKVTWHGPFSNNTKELLELLPRLNELMQQKWKEEAEPVAKGEGDGSFFMDYKDFLKVWQKVCVAVKFPRAYSGLRFFGEWTAENAGGTPLSPSPEAITAYGKNPQFILTVKGDKEVNVFVSLSQEDGRLKARGRERAPYPSFSSQICLVVMRLRDGETKVAKWGGNEVVNKLEIGNARSAQYGLTLGRGRYALVASTAQPGVLGRFFLSVYYDCPTAYIQVTDASGKLQPKPIREEEDEARTFPDNLKKVLASVLLAN